MFKWSILQKIRKNTIFTDSIVFERSTSYKKYCYAFNMNHSITKNNIYYYFLIVLCSHYNLKLIPCCSFPTCALISYVRNVIITNVILYNEWLFVHPCNIIISVKLITYFHLQLCRMYKSFPKCMSL